MEWVNWLGVLERFSEWKCGHLNWTIYECRADVDDGWQLNGQFGTGAAFLKLQGTVRR